MWVTAERVGRSTTTSTKGTARVREVDGTSAEYWDSPGSKVVQVANLVKAKVTGERYEGDNETVDLG